MALPMDEQRILDEMERVLAADDPKLAARLASFGRPGIGAIRTPRARAVLSLAGLALVAVIALVLYTVSAFRPGSATPSHHHLAQVTWSLPGTSQAGTGSQPGLPGPSVSQARPGIRP